MTYEEREVIDNEWLKYAYDDEMHGDKVKFAIAKHFFLFGLEVAKRRIKCPQCEGHGRFQLTEFGPDQMCDRCWGDGWIDPKMPLPR